MIVRIVIVVAILAALGGAYFVFKEPEQAAPEGFPSGSDIRNLKIN